MGRAPGISWLLHIGMWPPGLQGHGRVSLYIENIEREKENVMVSKW